MVPASEKNLENCYLQPLEKMNGKQRISSVKQDHGRKTELTKSEEIHSHEFEVDELKHRIDNNKVAHTFLTNFFKLELPVDIQGMDHCL